MSFITETTTYKRCVDCNEYVPFNRAVVHQNAHPSHNARCINHQTGAMGAHPRTQGGGDAPRETYAKYAGPTRPTSPDSRAHPYLTRSFPHKKNLSRRASSFFPPKDAPPVPQSRSGPPTNPPTPSRSRVHPQPAPQSSYRTFAVPSSPHSSRTQRPLRSTDSVESFFQNQVPRQTSPRKPAGHNYHQHAKPLSAHGSGQHAAYGFTSASASAGLANLASHSIPIPEENTGGPSNHYPSPAASLGLPSEWSEDDDDDDDDDGETVDGTSDGRSTHYYTPQHTPMQTYQSPPPLASPRSPVVNFSGSFGSQHTHAAHCANQGHRDHPVWAAGSPNYIMSSPQQSPADDVSMLSFKSI